MPAKQSLQRLSAQIDALINRVTAPRLITITAWAGETEEDAQRAYFAEEPADHGNITFVIGRMAWMTREEARRRGWAA